MSTNPKVSVIMSTFNAGKYIRQAIDSIVNQTYQDLELIIVDDGSTDNTGHIVNKYCAQHPQKMQYIYQDNAGPSKARNVGIKASRGEYIAILDSDDISLPQRLQKQVEFLDQNPDIALLGTGGWRINDRGKLIEEYKTETDEKTIKTELFQCNRFNHSSLMLRKKQIADQLFYREELKFAEDYELCLRISERFPVANLSECLSMRRVNPSSISFKEMKQKRILELIKQLAIERKLSRIHRIQIDHHASEFKTLPQRHEKASHYFHWAIRLYYCSDYRNSLSFLFKAILLKPLNRQIWKFLLINYLCHFDLLWKQMRVQKQ